MARSELSFHLMLHQNQMVVIVLFLHRYLQLLARRQRYWDLKPLFLSLLLMYADILISLRIVELRWINKILTTVGIFCVTVALTIDDHHVVPHRRYKTSSRIEWFNIG
jgi:hypothetical protein